MSLAAGMARVKATLVHTRTNRAKTPPPHNAAMKRFKIALAVLAVALVGVIVWQVSQPREPVYQGKTLTFWERCASNM
jgi:hypothetical protein